MLGYVKGSHETLGKKKMQQHLLVNYHGFYLPSREVKQIIVKKEKNKRKKNSFFEM